MFCFEVSPTSSRISLEGRRTDVSIGSDSHLLYDYVRSSHSSSPFLPIDRFPTLLIDSHPPPSLYSIPPSSTLLPAFQSTVILASVVYVGGKE